jgi:hypothetical protein
MVHFIRVELKDIIGEVKTTVDEEVINLLLMYSHGKELERIILESEMELVLSRVLTMRKHKEHRRR